MESVRVVAYDEELLRLQLGMQQLRRRRMVIDDKALHADGLADADGFREQLNALVGRGLRRQDRADLVMVDIQRRVAIEIGVVSNSDDPPVPDRPDDDFRAHHQARGGLRNVFPPMLRLSERRCADKHTVEEAHAIGRVPDGLGPGDVDGWQPRRENSARDRQIELGPRCFDAFGEVLCGNQGRRGFQHCVGQFILCTPRNCPCGRHSERKFLSRPDCIADNVACCAFRAAEACPEA